MLEVLKHCHHKQCSVKFSFDEVPGQITITVNNPEKQKSYSQCLPWDHIDNERIIGAIDFCLGKISEVRVFTVDEVNAISALQNLDLSIRAFNCLKYKKINSLAELVQYTAVDLLKKSQFGAKTIWEIENVLKDKGLSLGMEIQR